MAEDVLHLFKRHYFDLSGNKVIEYIMYNTTQPRLASISLNGLAEQIVQSSFRYSQRDYCVPECVVRSQISKQRNVYNKKKKKPRFIGEKEYFNRPLDKEKEEGLLEKMIDVLMKRVVKNIPVEKKEYTQKIKGTTCAY